MIGGRRFASAAAGRAKEQRVSPKLRPNLAQRVLMDRRVASVGQIMHTARERVERQLSNTSAHTVLPLSAKDRTTQTVQQIARQILLSQRARAAASWTDKHGVPVLRPVNGVRHFVLPLQRVLFNYCSHYRDSDGLKYYLRKNLKSLAETNPSVEFVVEPRWGHRPLIRGFFLGGHSQYVCVKNGTVREVHEAFLRLRNSSGTPLAKFRQKVTSRVPAVRPLWSPFHMLNEGKNNPLQRFIAKTGAAAAAVEGEDPGAKEENSSA